MCFWTDDLIYTSSAGRRIGKAHIMRELRAKPHPKPGEEPRFQKLAASPAPK